MSGGCGRWRECEGDMMREHERVREYESKIVYGNIYIYIHCTRYAYDLYILEYDSSSVTCTCIHPFILCTYCLEVNVYLVNRL